MDARDFDISLSDDLIAGRLPMMTQRYQLIAATHELGQEILAGREASARHHTGGAEYELGLALVACVGVCWRGQPLDCPSLRSHRYDVVAYGEGVMDALLMLGYDPSSVTRCGRVVKDRILSSLPTVEEIEEAADPTEARVERSI